MNDNDSLSLTPLEDAQDNLGSTEVGKSATYPGHWGDLKNTMHSSHWPMPESSWYKVRTSTKKGYISVIKRQKSCFRSAPTELRLFYLGGGVLRQECSIILRGQQFQKKNANKLTDQTKT